MLNTIVLLYIDTLVWGLFDEWKINCNIINVFIVALDQLNASLLDI